MNVLRRRARPLLTALLTLTFLQAPAAADSVAITGDLNVTWTTIGTGSTTGTATLAYTTVGPVTMSGASSRAVTVRLLEALPAGVNVTVTFIPDVGKGTSMGTLTLTTTAQVLVDLIPDDVEQLAKALTYVFSTTRGFESIALKVEYVLIED